MSEQKFASFAPEDMKEGSNLWDNVDARVTGFRFSKDAPDGYTAEGSPIFAWVDFELKGDGPAEERRVNQSYSLGSSSGDQFTVSEDGYKLIPATEDSALRKDSKFGTFVGSLVTEGIPLPILKAGDWSKVVGLDGHWKRVADKERNFGDDPKRSSRKSKFPPTTLVCTKIHSKFENGVIVGGAAVATPAVGAAPVTMSSPNAAGAVIAGDLDTKTGAYLAQVVASKGGKVQRSQLTLLVSQAAMKDPQRQDIARRAADEAFLNAMSEAGGVLDAAGNVVALKYNAAAKPQVVELAA